MYGRLYTNIRAFQTIESIDKLIKKEKLSEGEMQIKPVQKVRARAHRKEIVYENYTDPDIRLVIQHEPMFMTFITLIKKIKPYTTLHVENDSYLWVTLSSCENFPVVFMKFDIVHPMTQTNDLNNIWIDLPVGMLTNCIEKVDKTTNQYAILIREINNELKLEIGRAHV